MMIGTGDFDGVADGRQSLSGFALRLRHAKVPTVAAVFGYAGRACGGDALHQNCRQRRNLHRLARGGRGHHPCGGGTSTMLWRALSDLPPNADPYPAIRRVMETLGFGKVATSALEGVQYGFCAKAWIISW